jgi:predicted acylesterase/phospholipase RssA
MNKIMTIKHLVISGGGPIMIQILSAIQELEKNKILNINDIESIYGTSAGAIIGIIIALKFEWEIINDYIIKRPWQDVFPIKVQNILEAYTKKGIFDIKTIEKCFKPLFDAKDISLDINLKDFYELTKIDLHLFTFEINEYKIYDISHKSHPDLSVMKAIQMTSSIPILMTPLCIDNKCFIDGGVACNYPLNFCIESDKDENEILGFKNKYLENNSIINEETTLLDYLLNFLFKAIFSINTKYIQPSIKNEIIFDASYLSLEVLKNTFSKIEVRKELFEKGRETAIQFIDSLQNSSL